MSLFRLSMFRRLWNSTLGVSGAQGMERTATAWLVVAVGGGALAVGLAFAARMLPSLLFGLTAGTIADRADRPRQLVIVSVAAALLMLAFSALVSWGDIHVWQAIVFSFAAGCVQVFDTPARQALVLDVVEDNTALRALALVALASRCANALGAFVAGILIDRLGTARCFAVIAVIYGLAALLAALLRVAQAHRLLRSAPSFQYAFREAARLVLDVPALRVLFLAGMACEVFAFSHMSAVPLFAKDVLKVGSAGLGMLNAAASIGGAAAVALLSLLPEQVRRQPLLSGVFLLYGVSLIVVTTTHDVTLAAAVLLGTGFCAGAYDLLQQTLIQLAVPAAQRGRAIGIWLLSIGSAPVGYIEMGTLINVLGVSSALLVNGALTVTAALLLLVGAPLYRWSRADATK